MNRKKKLILNFSTSLIYQIISFICGFILPRIRLTYYGSEVNGLVSSVSQFLSLITLCECGVGAVVQSALYKPLALQDNAGISKIIISAERFFRKIAYILIGYTAVLVVFYPLITLNEFDYIYTTTLILAMAVSTFAQYYFGMSNRLLLNADQMGFVYYAVQSVTLILNSISCVILVKYGAPIQMVQLATSCIFLLQPVVLSVTAKRRYRIDRKIKLTEEPIKQKWNGLAQHIAAVVLGNTDTVVLTMLSTLENVSIYSVYNLVVHGVRQIVVSATNGIQPLLGNMLAKKETRQLEQTYDAVEWLIHTLVTVAFSITAMTILPFVRVYTKDIADADYIVPAFAYLITLAQASYCFRLPYNMMVVAAGHFKQTQKSAIIEAVLNVVLSVVLVKKLGLVGVAIGTFAAMLYRTLYLVNYLSKNILYRSWKHFLKNSLIDAGCVVGLVLVVNCFSGFYTMGDASYFAWIILALKVGITSLLIEAVINTLFNREKLRNSLLMVKHRIIKR